MISQMWMDSRPPVDVAPMEGRSALWSGWQGGGKATPLQMELELWSNRHLCRESLKLTKHISYTGVALCLPYLLIVGICLAQVIENPSDFKGHVAFLQAPIALQIALLQAMGLGSLLDNWGWWEGYAFLCLPTFALLYLFGWLVGTLFDS
jgi:hypothetical protein